MLKISDFFKVNPDHDCCYIAYGGEEHRKTDYEAGFDFEETKTHSSARGEIMSSLPFPGSGYN
jgi:hypothetical protein